MNAPSQEPPPTLPAEPPPLPPKFWGFLLAPLVPFYVVCLTSPAGNLNQALAGLAILALSGCLAIAALVNCPIIMAKQTRAFLGILTFFGMLLLYGGVVYYAWR